MTKTNRQRFILFTSLTMIFSVSNHSLAETGKPPNPVAVASGKKLYEQHCQVCHQKDGVGQNQVPRGISNPDYIPAMPLNETSHAWHHSDEQLVKTILTGIPQRNMPAWANILAEKQAQDIVAYIKSLWSTRILECQGPKHMSCM